MVDTITNAIVDSLIMYLTSVECLQVVEFKTLYLAVHFYRPVRERL